MGVGAVVKAAALGVLRNIGHGFENIAPRDVREAELLKARGVNKRRFAAGKLRAVKARSRRGLFSEVKGLGKLAGFRLRFRAEDVNERAFAHPRLTD